MNKITLFNLSALEALKKIPNESVDCIITSPPYFNLRIYKDAEAKWPEGWEGQLGNEESIDAYLNHLLLITAELKRVMKPTGTMFWNMSDTYAGSGGAGGDYNEGGIYEGQPKYRQGKTSIPAKSRMMIPERFAMMLIDDDGDDDANRWCLRNDLVWYKPSAMPGSFTDRLTCTWEHVYFFVKSRDYYFNLNAIRAKKTYPNQHVKELCEEIYKRAKEMRHQTKFLSYEGKVKMENAEMLSSPRARQLRSSTGSLQEFIIAIRSIAKSIIESHPELTEKEKDYINWFQHNQSGNIEGSNPGDVYTQMEEQAEDFFSINTEPLSESHFAAFPKKLVERCIKAGCPEGGTVLDPFAGSGTTLLVAKELGMNSIGIEISQEYCSIIERRCRIKEAVMLNHLEYELIKPSRAVEVEPISDITYLG